MTQINTWPGWECVRKIGEGSFGKVYEIQRQEHGQIYVSALKVISIPQSEDELENAYSSGMDKDSAERYFKSFVDEISNEIVLMSKLKGYTNIVSYEDHMVIKHQNDIGWDILIRMELLTPLLTWVKDHPMFEEDVLKMGCDMCRALELCHKNKIIHRDIKPQNIFVNKNGDFKLGDFGIARIAEDNGSVKSQKGTYTYMAPEVFRGQHYDEKADIYSLGIVLYRFLNQNRTPFLPMGQLEHADMQKAFDRRMAGEEIPLPENGSEDLKWAVLSAIQYDQKMRFQNAAALRMALEKCYMQIGKTINHPETQWEIAASGPKRKTSGKRANHRKVWAIVGIAAAVFVLIAIGIFFSIPEEENEEPVSVASQEKEKIEIRVNPDLLQYREMTYGQFKQQTGVIASYEYDYLYSAQIPDTELKVVFHAALGLEDNTSCWRLEGELDSLVNGITGTMTIDELLNALSWENGSMPTYYVREAAEMLSPCVGEVYAVVSFDSDGDEKTDAELYVSLDESGKMSASSDAWLTLNVIVKDVLDMECEEAITCLEEQGFKVDCIEEYSSSEKQGKVVGQTPAGGSELQYGTRIKLYIGKGSEETSEADRYMPLFQYEGYLDEYRDWPNYEFFYQKDYDDDGVTDRVYRNVNEEDGTCVYEIQFGNGNALKIDAVFYTYESIAIETADLTENDRDEIVFYTGNITGTGFREYGNLVVYGWSGELYEELPLPFEMNQKYTRTLKVNYVREDDSNFVNVKIPSVNFEKRIIVDDYWWDNESYADSYSSDSYDECVWMVYLQKSADRETLVCKINLFSYKHSGGIEVYLDYKDGKFAIGDVLYLDNNDAPGNQYSIERVGE